MIGKRHSANTGSQELEFNAFLYHGAVHMTNGIRHLKSSTIVSKTRPSYEMIEKCEQIYPQMVGYS